MTGDRLLDAVDAVLARWRPERLLVGFSGGADSLCLLDALCRLVDRSQISAAIVDHRLRVASTAEAEAAGDRARRLGVEVQLLEPDQSFSRPGNAQAWARELRRRLLLDTAQDQGAALLLAHNADDQAESVLMRLVDGCAPVGMNAAEVERGVLLLRPLLAMPRTAIEAYLTRHRLEPVIDPTNASACYRRNRLRHAVMPLLRAENPQVAQAFSRAAENLVDERRALDHAAMLIYRQCWQPAGLDVSSFGEFPLSLLRAVVSHAFAALREARLTRRHWQAIAELCRTTDGTRALDLPGLRLQRCYRHLRASAAAPCERLPAPLALDGPGLYPWGSARLAVVEVERSLTAADVPWCGERLLVRAPVPGDRIAVGPRAHRKVARVLLDAKLPRERRPWQPIVIGSEDRVLAVAGIRLAHGLARGGPALRFSVER